MAKAPAQSVEDWRLIRTSSVQRMHATRALHYRFAVQFPDSTFAALHIRADDDESVGWGRLLSLAIVLTIAAVSAGLLAGG